MEGIFGITDTFSKESTNVSASSITPSILDGRCRNYVICYQQADGYPGGLPCHLRSRRNQSVNRSRWGLIGPVFPDRLPVTPTSRTSANLKTTHWAVFLHAEGLRGGARRDAMNTLHRW